MCRAVIEMFNIVEFIIPSKCHRSLHKTADIYPMAMWLRVRIWNLGTRTDTDVHWKMADN